MKLLCLIKLDIGKIQNRLFWFTKTSVDISVSILMGNSRSYFIYTTTNMLFYPSSISVGFILCYVPQNCPNLEKNKVKINFLSSNVGDRHGIDVVCKYLIDRIS